MSQKGEGKREGKSEGGKWIRAGRWRRARSSRLRHPFQRHVGSNQRAKKRVGRRREGREEEGFTLKYVDPQAILGLFSLHPAGCSGRIPVRHAGRESLYIVWYKNIALFSSLSGPKRAASPALLLTLLLRSARRPRACDHHYARPPLVPRSSPRSPSLILLRNLLPSFLRLVSLPIPPPLGYLLPQITYPLNESRDESAAYWLPAN